MMIVMSVVVITLHVLTVLVLQTAAPLKITAVSVMLTAQMTVYRIVREHGVAI